MKIHKINQNKIWEDLDGALIVGEGAGACELFPNRLIISLFHVLLGGPLAPCQWRISL